MCMFRMSNRFLSTPRNVVTATPRVVKRSTSVVRIPAPTPQELQMEVGVTSDETLPIMMSSGGTTTVDPEVVYVGKHKMLQVHGVDTDVVCSPNTLELDANAVVVNGEFYLNDGQHKLQIPYPTKPNTVLTFDGYEMKWLPKTNRRLPKK